jgi:hypothetical protein
MEGRLIPRSRAASRALTSNGSVFSGTASPTEARPGSLCDTATNGGRYYFSAGAINRWCGTAHPHTGHFSLLSAFTTSPAEAARYRHAHSNLHRLQWAHNGVVALAIFSGFVGSGWCVWRISSPRFEGVRGLNHVGYSKRSIGLRPAI